MILGRLSVRRVPFMSALGLSGLVVGGGTLLGTASTPR